MVQNGSGVPYGAPIKPVLGGSSGTADPKNAAQCLGAAGDSVGWIHLEARVGGITSPTDKYIVVGYSHVSADTATVQTSVNAHINKINGTIDGTVITQTEIFPATPNFVWTLDADPNSPWRTIFFALSGNVPGLVLDIAGTKAS